MRSEDDLIPPPTHTHTHTVPSLCLSVWGWAEEELRACRAAVAECLGKQAVQQVEQQEQQLAGCRHAVGERGARVQRCSDVRELSLGDDSDDDR